MSSLQDLRAHGWEHRSFCCSNAQLTNRTSNSFDCLKRLFFPSFPFEPPSQKPNTVGVSDILEEKASASVSFRNADKALDSAAALITTTGDEDEDEDELYLRRATISSKMVESVLNWRSVASFDPEKSPVLEMMVLPRPRLDAAVFCSVVAGTWVTSTASSERYKRKRESLQKS